MRIDFDYSTLDTYPVGREFFRERWRRASVREPVFISVPRARDTSVDDAAFTKRSVLMRAKIGDGADLAILELLGSKLKKRLKKDREKSEGKPEKEAAAGEKAEKAKS